MGNTLYHVVIVLKSPLLAPQQFSAWWSDLTQTWVKYWYTINLMLIFLSISLPLLSHSHMCSSHGLQQLWGIHPKVWTSFPSCSLYWDVVHSFFHHRLKQQSHKGSKCYEYNLTCFKLIKCSFHTWLQFLSFNIIH